MRIGIVYGRHELATISPEFVCRLKYTLDQLEVESVVVDPFGYGLHWNGKDFSLDSLSSTVEVDVALYLDYFTPKCIDSTSYVTHLSKLSSLVFDMGSGTRLSASCLNHIYKSVIAHDYMLSTPSVDVARHMTAQFTVAIDKPEQLEEGLYESYPVIDGMEYPDFGCAKTLITESTVKTLNFSRGTRARIKAKKSNLVFTDALYSNYSATSFSEELRSRVHKLNQCGIAVILEEPGLDVPNEELFMACAAKCLIVSSRNGFVERVFGNSVIYIDDLLEGEEGVNQIEKKIKEIRKSVDECNRKARECHEIFKKNFSLDSGLTNLISKHASNMKRHKNEMQKILEHSVDIYYFCNEFDERDIEDYCDQLSAMENIRIRGVMVVDDSKTDQALSLRRRHAKNGKGCPCEVVGIRKLTQRDKGAVFYEVFSKYSAGSFFSIWSPGVSWHSNHLASLVQHSLNTGNLVIQSNALSISNGNRSIGCEIPGFYEQVMSRVEIADLIELNNSKIDFSSFLFGSKLLHQDWKVAGMLMCLSELYPFLFILMSFTKYSKVPGHVPRITTVKNEANNRNFGATQIKEGSFSLDQQRVYLRNNFSSIGVYRSALSLYGAGAYLALEGRANNLSDIKTDSKKRLERLFHRLFGKQ